MEPAPQVLKEATCPSLSAASIITYQTGKTPDGIIHIRLTGNSGNGFFNGFWVPMPKILSVLQEQDGPFIWSALCPLFEGRSVNSACFLMSVLLSEKIVNPSKLQPRRYELAEVTPKKPKKGGKTTPPVDPAMPTEATA